MKVLSIHLCSGYYPILSSQGLSSPFIASLSIKSLPPSPWFTPQLINTFYYVPFLKKERKKIWKINFNSSLGPSHLSPSTRFFYLHCIVQTALLMYELLKPSPSIHSSTNCPLRNTVRVTSILQVTNSSGHFSACIFFPTLASYLPPLFHLQDGLQHTPRLGSLHQSLSLYQLQFSL